LRLTSSWRRRRSQLIGHADAGFTLRVYARDTRNTASIVKDVLNPAATAKLAR
jgi:hypothetical protein